MTTNSLPPGGFPAVGFVGAGQLARMSAAPAEALSLHVRLLAEAPDAAATQVFPDMVVGAADDLDAVMALARRCDVVTFDHEHVPQPVLQALEAEGHSVQPPAKALLHAQDKLEMRRRLSAAGIPCPAWAQVRSADELAQFLAEHGGQAVVKTPRGGYDGKGVRVITSVDDAADWLEAVQTGGDAGPLSDGILAEEAVVYTREVAALVARSVSGQGAAWPVVETVQTDGICTEVIAPAPDMDDEAASGVQSMALRIAEELGVTGVMAVELFEVTGDNGQPVYLVNELAMRPHNSGHWTIDGSVTSQFEQHLRAVLDLPLGETTLRAPWCVMGNVLGGEDTELYSTYRHLLARDPGLKVHLYGKAVRPGRKIGHVTVCGDDLTALRRRAEHAANYIQGVERE